MSKDNPKVSLSLRELPLSLRFIIKAWAFRAHHKYLNPPVPDNLDFSTLNQFINTSFGWIGLLAYIVSYIGLFVLLVRICLLVLMVTYEYFQKEGFSFSSLVRYIRYGLER